MSEDWTLAAEAVAWSSPTARLADFSPLLPAEAEMIAGLHTGTFDRLGDGARPARSTPGRIVRARFLRFLMLGGDEECRPHEKGVRVQGAWISGVLDLESCRIFRDVGLRDCHFEATPVLRAAVVNQLFLDGSRLPGIEAERLEVRGGVHLRGAEVYGELNLDQAQFGANLECDDATLHNPGGLALRADCLEARNVLMRRAVVHGAIALSAAKLRADLDLARIAIPEGQSPILNATEIEISGNLILRNARAAGELRFLGSRIAGDVDCSGTLIENAVGRSLELSRAVVKGAFFLRHDAHLDGTLALTGTSIGTIHDDAACWPKTGNLLLNRCRYDAFIDGPVDAESRLDWLGRQTSPDRAEDFWPQPYEHLAYVLREMGHDNDARAVQLAKERLLRRVRRLQEDNPVWRAVLYARDAIVAVTVGYGLRPFRALVWLALFWLIGVLIFNYAERQGAVMPNSPVVIRAPDWTLCGITTSETRELFLNGPSQGLAEPGQSQLDCFRERWEASSYPLFNPWVYSLDTLLPVLELGQRAYWRPNVHKPAGRIAINYLYFQSLVGWALSLLAVAGFSGLVRSR